MSLTPTPTPYPHQTGVQSEALDAADAVLGPLHGVQQARGQCDKGWVRGGSRLPGAQR